MSLLVLVCFNSVALVCLLLSVHCDYACWCQCCDSVALVCLLVSVCVLAGVSVALVCLLVSVCVLAGVSVALVRLLVLVCSDSVALVCCYCKMLWSCVKDRLAPTNTPCYY